MLVREGLDRLDKPDRRERLGRERLLIAAAQKAVRAVDQNAVQSGRIRIARLFGVASEFARRRVVLAAEDIDARGVDPERQRFGEDAHHVRPLDAVVADRRPDDVVVEVPSDIDVLRGEGLGEVGAPEESLLLGIETGEDNGCVQRDGGQHAGRFEHRRDGGAVVVSARGVGDAIVVIGISRVVVARHHVRAAGGIVALERREDRRDRDRARNPLCRIGRLLVRIQRDRHAPAAAARDRTEALQQVGARGEDAAARGRVFGERRAGSEGDQPLVGRAQFVGGDACQDGAHDGVERRRWDLRRCWQRCEQRQRACRRHLLHEVAHTTRSLRRHAACFARGCVRSVSAG